MWMLDSTILLLSKRKQQNRLDILILGTEKMLNLLGQTDHNNGCLKEFKTTLASMKVGYSIYSSFWSVTGKETIDSGYLMEGSWGKQHLSTDN